MSGRDLRSISREGILLGLGCFIMGVWTFGVVTQILFPSHELPNQVHVIAGVVATSLFGGAALASRKGQPPDA